MKKVLKTLMNTAVCTALLASNAVLAGQFIEASSAAEAIENSYIVKFKQNVSSLSRASKANSLATQFKGKVHRLYKHALDGAVIHMTRAQARSMANHPLVEYVEQNQRLYGYSTSSWGIDRVDQHNLPLDNDYTPSFDGAGIDAYVIDSGINTSHVEFTGRIGNGQDFVGDGQGVEDCNGHGSHVAGTLGGNTFGVANKVILHPIRVLDCNRSGSVGGVIAGIEWMIEDHTSGPAVANMSLGPDTPAIFVSLNDATKNAVNDGIVMVVSAGNNTADACTTSPASEPSAITVASSDISDIRANTSNFGSCVDVFAPGVNITSALNGGTNASGNKGGTSMASPHVAGIAALILQQNSSLSPAEVAQEVTDLSTKNIVTDAGAGSPNRLAYYAACGKPLSGTVGTTLEGSSASDSVFLNSGSLGQSTINNDALRGMGGNDVLYSNNGNDCIEGGDGNDEIGGGSGDDSLWGGNGDDLIFGGPGNDFIVGGDGNDTIFGGSGNDIIVASIGGEMSLQSESVTNFSVTSNNQIETEKTVLDGGEGDDIYIIKYVDIQLYSDERMQVKPVRINDNLGYNQIFFEEMDSTEMVFKNSNGNLEVYGAKSGEKFLTIQENSTEVLRFKDQDYTLETIDMLINK